jgi:hypothetical protein
LHLARRWLASDGRPVPPSTLDLTALRELLRAQDGLVAVRQAAGVGLSSSAMNRRVRAGDLRKVLPLVYLEGSADLTQRQRVRAALLFTGDGGSLTGEAALLWRRLEHLPREVSGQIVDVLVPAGRHLRTTQWVRVTRVARSPAVIRVDGVPTVHVARAVVDASRRLTSYDAVLSLLSCAINTGRATLDDVRNELVGGSPRGCRLLRQALAEADSGIRSIAEASARRLFRRHGLPEPLVNEPIWVDGHMFVPDFRWGRVIVEIDSRAYHLLEDGAWERTQARRAALQAAGYHVLPYTPGQIRDMPEIVIAGIVNALRLQAA